MASGRQPRAKGEQKGPEILRAVRLGTAGDVYGPGEEEEMLEALEESVKDHNEELKAGGRGQKLTVKSEVERLTMLGHLVNFAGVSVDDEDIDHADPDLRANSRARALVETNAVGEEGDGMTRRARRRARVAQTDEGVESGSVERDDSVAQ